MQRAIHVSLGANDRVRVGIVGFSDRFRGSLAPQFLAQSKELNFEIVAVSDLWSKRRDEATAYFKAKGSYSEDSKEQ